MDENRMTQILDTVATQTAAQVFGQEWDGLDMVQRRNVKEQLLPVVLATVEAADASPTVEFLLLKRQVESDLDEDMGITGEHTEYHVDVANAWDKAFPNHPLDLIQYEN